MQKYFTSFRLFLSMALDYRFENLLWMFIDIIPIVIAIITWKSIFSDRPMLAGITFAQLVLYYIATIFIDKVTATHFEERWIDRVKKGQIDTYFIRPIKFPIFLLFELFANRILSLLIFVLPLTVLMLLFLGNFVSTLTLSTTSLIFLPMFLACAFYINFLLSFIILLCAIWFEEAESLSHAKWLGASIFGGIMAPLQFFPPWMQKVSEFLPFRRMIALPASMFTQTYDVSYLFKELGILMMFALLCTGVAHIVWKKAVEAYTSFGG